MDEHTTSDLPAISITLEEIKHLFDLEEGRRQSLETKAGILLGFVGIFLTIVGIYYDDKFTVLLPFWFFIGLSLYFGFLVIRLRKYQIPHKKYDEFYQYAKKDEKEVMDQFLSNYIKAATHAEKLNNKKANYLTVSFVLTIVAVIYLIGFTIYKVL